jgi:hypothetical protein
MISKHMTWKLHHLQKAMLNEHNAMNKLKQDFDVKMQHQVSVFYIIPCLRVFKYLQIS